MEDPGEGLPVFFTYLQRVYTFINVFHVFAFMCANTKPVKHFFMLTWPTELVVHNESHFNNPDSCIASIIIMYSSVC